MTSVGACGVRSLSNDYASSSARCFYMQLHRHQRVHLMVFCTCGSGLGPRLFCACDFIKGVCFHGMAETQKKLKRKAHNLPIIPIMCQNIEEWFMWQSPCMTICCFMASECRDKYNFLWKRHKITKSWWPNTAERGIWFIFQFFHPREHYKINITKISSETWGNGKTLFFFFF